MSTSSNSIESPAILELRDGVSAQRVTCAVMLVLGFTLLVIQLLPDAQPSVFAYVLGGLLVAAGTAGIMFVRSFDVRVDVASGNVLIGRERLRGRPARDIPAQEIVNVTIEESIDAEGVGAFRVALVLRDGSRIPLNDDYSLHHARVVTIAELMRARLPELTAAPPLPLPRGRVPSPGTLRGEAYLVAIMLLAAAGLVAVGVHFASEEQRLLRQFRPVTVIVEDARVQSRLGGNGETMRRPSVMYSYQVDGVTYRSDRVTPLDEWRQGGWAREISQRFTPGRRYEGYYDPRDPSQSYLLRRRNAVPILLIAIPLFGVLALSAGGPRRPPPSPRKVARPYRPPRAAAPRGDREA